MLKYATAGLIAVCLLVAGAIVYNNISVSKAHGVSLHPSITTTK